MQDIGPQVVLMQLEIPTATVTHAATLAGQAGALVILDPAPAGAALPAGLLQSVTVLTPNEGELATLTGMATGTIDETASAAHALRSAAHALRSAGVSIVVVKRGEHGALVAHRDGTRSIAAPNVDAVDTTGAGDCFDGALAVGLLEGWPIDRAVRFATHAAALACTRPGALSAQVTRAEIRRLLPDFNAG